MNHSRFIQFNFMNKAILLMTLLLCLPAFMFAWTDWKTVANQHFKIYYKDNWQAEADKVLQTLEYYRPQLEKLTGNTKGRIPFTIQDIGNMANGYTDVVGTKIALFAYPPTSDELSVGEDWWQMVANHEYLHMLQMTKATGTPELIRLLLGNIFYPNLWQPGWMTEGITVYGESQLSKYAGRLNGGTYPSIITELAKKDKLPSPTKASYFSYDTPHATYYTFGGSFYDYLTKTYGQDKLAQLFEQTSSSTWSYSSVLLPNLSLDKSYQSIFGKDVGLLWADWKAYEQNKNYQLPEHKITSGGWFKTDLKEHNGKLYYIDGTATKTGPSSSFFSYKLCSIDIAEMSSVRVTQTSKQSLSSDTKHRTVIVQNVDFPAGYNFYGDELYYTRSEWKRGFANSEMDGFGSVVQLWKRNLNTGKRTKLYAGQIRAFCPMPDGSILLSEDNATHTQTTLSRLAPGSKLPSAIYQTNGLISSIHRYGNNLILGYKAPWRNNGVYLFEFANSRLTPVVQTPYYTFPVSVSGDDLVFNAVFDGIYGAYVMNLKSNNYSRITNVSDVRTPVVTGSNRTYFISINESGYDLYHADTNLTPYRMPADPIPSSPLQSRSLSGTSASPITRETKIGGFFSNLGHLIVPRILHMPILYGTGDTLIVGAMLMGSDIVGDFPGWNALVQYDVYNKDIDYSASLSNYFFHPLKQIIGYTDADEQTLSSMQYLELLKRQNYGLNEVWAGFSYITKEAYSRKIWTPFVQFIITTPTNNLTVNQSVPIETEKIVSSDRERLGWQTLVQFHQRLPLSSELKAVAFIAEDGDADDDEVFGAIRGYSKEMNVNRGAIFQASIYKPVLKIREGLWSPQIYLEDVNLGVFYDTALPYDTTLTEKHESYGAELLLELGLAYNFRLNAGVRVSKIKDTKEPSIEFIMSSLF